MTAAAINARISVALVCWLLGGATSASARAPRRCLGLPPALALAVRDRRGSLKKAAHPVPAKAGCVGRRPVT